MHFISRARWFVLTLILAACGPEKVKKQLVPFEVTKPTVTANQTPDEPPKPAPPVKVPGSEILVMSYNLHNFFDTEHDTFEEPTRKDGKPTTRTVDRRDWQYLPLEECKKAVEEGKHKNRDGGKGKCEDWTPEKYKVKLEQVAKVFELRKISRNEKSYPDIAAFSEVENEKVVKDIQNRLGYSGQVTSFSRDMRGIDVAVVFNESKNLKYVAHKQIDLLDTEGEGYSGRTRPILEVEFESAGAPLFVYVNHWSSQHDANPARDRLMAALRLRKEIESRYNSNPKANFVALGDFNTIGIEKDGAVAHPFFDLLLNHGLDDVPPSVKDVKPVAMRAGVPVFKGSYVYNDRWQDLDRFFVNEELLDKKGLDLMVESFEIFNNPELLWVCKEKKNYCVQPMQVPIGYRHYVEPGKGHPGYSDHLPIYMKLVQYK